MVTTVNLIGAGRVGQTLLRCLADRPEYVVQHVASSRIESAHAAVEAVGVGTAVPGPQAMAEANIWLLTVPDTRISHVADSIAATLGGRTSGSPKVAIHCSGYHSAEVMAPLRTHGWHLASAHPMLSFADPKTAATNFPGTLCGVEGDPEAIQVTERLLSVLGARPFQIKSEAKALYHAAAVFTNNFTTVLQGIALEGWKAAGVPDDFARELQNTLLRSTVENVERQGPQDALTGPAARGDDEVVRDQGQHVSDWHPEAGRVYRDLSELAARLKKTG